MIEHHNNIIDASEGGKMNERTGTGELHLQKNESKYLEIIDNLNFGLLEVDLNNRIQYVNKSFCNKLEYTEKELIGSLVSDLLFTSKDLRKIKDQNKNRLKGESAVYEIKVRKKSGDPVWLHISVAPLLDNDKNIIGSIGLNCDITERKKDELNQTDLLRRLSAKNEDLKVQQNYLRAINKFATVILKKNTIEEIVWEITRNVISNFGFEDCIVYLVDKSGKHLNQVAAYGPKNPKDKVIKEQIIIPMGKGIVGTVAASGKPEIVNDTTKDKRYILDDEYRFSELSVPILADGKVIGVIDSEHPDKNHFTEEHLETLTTISGLVSMKLKNAISFELQKIAEQALMESESKLRLVIDSSLDAIITIDDKGIITEWNLQAEEIFGYTYNQVDGKSLHDIIIPPRFRKAYIGGMKYFSKHRKGTLLNNRFETIGYKKDKIEFPIEISLVPIKIGTNYFFSAFIRDITLEKESIKEIENALIKERELNQLRSRFVSMASHEFRTPLTTIQTNVDLISFVANSASPELTWSLKKNFNRINSEINRLTHLMNETLLLGKLESKNVSFNPKEINLVGLCKDIISTFNKEGEDINIDFEVSGKEKTLLIDKNLFIHILNNLISNSFKYSDDNTQLKLIFGKGKVEILVIDSGIGIPKADLPHLFDSFYRGSNVQNRQGSGLGLSIVKQFVELHNCEIEVESEEEKGTVFKITLNQIKKSNIK